MSSKPIKANKGTIGGASDVVMTPPIVAAKLVGLLPIKPGDVCLDPSMGDGAFFNAFPQHCVKDWCEISKGRDFFACTTKCDWIITNPPYSIYDKFLGHAFSLADNVVLLVPFSKVASSLGRIKMIMEYGGIYRVWFVGASRCGFPFGFPCSFIWFKRGYSDNWTMLEGV